MNSYLWLCIFAKSTSPSMWKIGRVQEVEKENEKMEHWFTNTCRTCLRNLTVWLSSNYTWIVSVLSSCILSLDHLKCQLRYRTHPWFPSRSTNSTIQVFVAEAAGASLGRVFRFGGKSEFSRVQVEPHVRQTQLKNGTCNIVLWLTRMGSFPVPLRVNYVNFSTFRLSPVNSNRMIIWRLVCLGYTQETHPIGCSHRFSVIPNSKPLWPCQDGERTIGKKETFQIILVVE